jgi:hypothetical protein
VEEAPVVLALAPEQPVEEPPVVLAVAEDQPDEEARGKKTNWGLVQPESFAIAPKKILMGVEYEISDADTEDVVGLATEKVTANKALVGYFMGRQMMEGIIAVIDEDTDKPVLLIERSNFRMSLTGAKPCKVKLFDHREKLLAQFKFGEPMWSGIALDFNKDTTVYDGSKEEWGVLEGDKDRAPDYLFRSAAGKKLARVRGKGTTNGMLAPSGSWTGKGGWLKVSISDGIDLTPTDKLIVLGTAVAIESIITTMFETKPGTIRLG